MTIYELSFRMVESLSTTQAQPRISMYLCAFNDLAHEEASVQEIRSHQLGNVFAGRGKPSFMEQSDPMALVCTLPDGDQAQRRSEIQALLQNRTALTRHPDGVELEWEFSEETARSLLDFILFERTCCKTFTYELGFAPPQNRITLRMRASAEQVEALQALYC